MMKIIQNQTYEGEKIPSTIGTNGFMMILQTINYQQIFSMVVDHWSNNAMLAMHCQSLTYTTSAKTTMIEQI